MAVSVDHLSRWRDVLCLTATESFSNLTTSNGIKSPLGTEILAREQMGGSEKGGMHKFRTTNGSRPLPPQLPPTQSPSERKARVL
jgi:hypothetical protein